MDFGRIGDKLKVESNCESLLVSTIRGAMVFVITCDCFWFSSASPMKQHTYLVCKVISTQ
jgi:hypothetical protein